MCVCVCVLQVTWRANGIVLYMYEGKVLMDIKNKQMHNDIRQTVILPASIRVLLFTSVVVRCREQLSVRPHLVFFVPCCAFLFKLKMPKHKHTLLAIK